MQEQSTLEENKALLRRWFDEVWNQGHAEAIDEMFAADGVAHGLSDLKETRLLPAVRCAANMLAIISAWRRATRPSISPASPSCESKMARSSRPGTTSTFCE